jgi:hypothetical protein
MMTQAARMMQTADRRDDVAMLLQRLQRTRELVILARRRDLVVQRVHAVREVDEGAALRRLAMAFSAARSGTMHSSMGSEMKLPSAEGVAAIEEPGLGEIVHKME